jgi:glutathione S-transferase
MKLYGSLTSPYVRKVRVFLREKDIAYEFITEGPSDTAGNVSRLNPLGKIPVLIREDGEALFDSPMIVEYLDSLQGEPLIPSPGEARWQAQRWHALGQGIADAVVTRLTETRRSPERQDPAVIHRQEGKIAAALNFAERHTRGGEFLVENRLTVADIAVSVALGYVDLRYAHDWRNHYPRLAQWLSVFSRRPSFVETMPS